MKRLRRIVSWTIWSFLALYLTVIVLIQLPFVQSWIGNAVAGAISKKLGTEVRVGRVDLGFLNRLIIDDVVIEDQQRHELLRANRMAVKLELLPLLKGRVSVNSAQLFGMRATLYRDSADAVPNFQFVLDSLASKGDKEKTPLDIHVGSLIIRHSAVTYDQLDAPETPGRLNPQHLNLSDISAHVLLPCLTDDSLCVNVKRVAMREQSGLSVNRLSLHFEANRRQALLSNFCLQTPRSIISADSIAAFYQFDRIKETLHFRGSLRSDDITPADFASLLPTGLQNMAARLPAPTMELRFEGTPKSVKVPRFSLKSADFGLQASGTVETNDEGLMTWQGIVGQMDASHSLIAVVGDALPDLPAVITNMGNVSLTGTMRGNSHGDMSLQGDISTSAGSVAISMNMTDGGSRFEGHVDTDSLNLYLLSGNDQSLGLVAAHVDVSGIVSPRERQNVSVRGLVPRLDWNGYHYQGIELDARWQPQDISGRLKIDDPNIQTEVEGELRQKERPAVRLTGYIRDLAPQALHLSDRWGDATLSAIVDADFTASSLYDAEGTLDIDDFLLLTGKNEEAGEDDDEATTRRTFAIDNLHLKSGYEDDIHFLRINGDFGEMLLRGNFDWATLPQSFINYVATKLPTFPGLPANLRQSNNNFDLTLRLNDTEWMATLLGIPLHIEEPLQLHATVNDPEHDVSIEGRLPAFTYADSPYRDGVLSLATEGDSAHCSLQLAKVLKNDRLLGLDLNIQAANNKLTSELSWNLHDQTYGNLQAITQLYTNDSGKPEAHVSVLPSHVMMKGTSWLMDPSDIIYSHKRLMVDHLTLRHEDQYFTIDGIASTHPTDTLTLWLGRAPVPYLLDFVNFRAVKFSGLATGQVAIVQPFGDIETWADLNVPDFQFQDAPMGALQAHAEWDSDEQRLLFDAAIGDELPVNTLLQGNLSLKDDHLGIDIQARGTPINFIHSFTRSFMSHIDGQAFGRVSIAGPLKQLELTGNVAVNGVATIAPLGTTYTMRGDSIRMVPGDIRFDNFHVYDRNDHTATINGGVHHHHLKQVTFDLGIDANQLLTYEHTDMAGSNIGGTVYADGRADIQGRPGETVIDIVVTPTPGSVFNYNVSSPDAINRQQFITWGEKTSHEQDLASVAAIPSEPSTVRHSAESSSDLRINFRINANPNATLRLLMNQQTGDYITLAGCGVLRASYYNKGPFQMFGTYNVDQGTYSMTLQNILKKIFTFQPGGTIVFQGDPFEAVLALKALYTVNGVSLSDLNIGNTFTSNTIRVNCLMNITGTAGNPQVDFDLEMPTVNSEEQQMIRSIIAGEEELNQQVVYLLGIGRFYTQDANNAGTQQYGQTELAMQSLLSGTVSTQINELLSQVIKSDGWNFGANISTGNEGWHNAEYEGIVSGRMLNNRLLINGQFGYRDNATQATPSFIGDFDISYLLTPSGNLALKVYNLTNDRYFTHSSLNTQGVGLVLKKDFGRIGELFRRKSK
ncbi:MAG: translocation/assembly module TamB [Prevotella sp.]|nr:translocation/assembly module TamB [Prevotella sp.]